MVSLKDQLTKGIIDGNVRARRVINGDNWTVHMPEYLKYLKDLENTDNYGNGKNAPREWSYNELIKVSSKEPLEDFYIPPEQVEIFFKWLQEKKVDEASVKSPGNDGYATKELADDTNACKWDVKDDGAEDITCIMNNWFKPGKECGEYKCVNGVFVKPDMAYEDVLKAGGAEHSCLYTVEDSVDDTTLDGEKGKYYYLGSKHDGMECTKEGDSAPAFKAVS